MSTVRDAGRALSFPSRQATDALRRRRLGLESLESRLLMATMPDFVTLSSLSTHYGDGYFQETKQPVLPTMAAGQVQQFDFRTNPVGDQTAQIALPSDLSTLRLLVDPNQDYGLWFVAQTEGSLSVSAFDGAGSSLGLLNLPYVARQPQIQHGNAVEVYSILGDAGTELPAGTAWIQFEQRVFEHARFGFLDDQSPMIPVGNSSQRWHSELPVRIDTNQPNIISYQAIFQGASSLIHSLGYEALDADLRLIEGVHVQRYDTADDTRLAAALNPGDTTITVESATGWANSSLDPRDRSIAWYGYTDTQGTTYADYSYTRNVARDVAHGMWNVGAIQGNVITLRTPWSGPALPIGAAIRNAVDGPSLVASLVDRSTLSQEHSAAISGTWENGIRDRSKFPAGAAFFRLAAWTNQTFMGQDQQAMLRMWHNSHGQRSAHNSAIDNRRRAEIRPTDNDASALPVVRVTQGNYGSVEILTQSGGTNRLRYTSNEYWIGSDFFDYTVRKPDGTELTERVYIESLGGNADSDPARKAAVEANVGNVTDTTNFRQSQGVVNQTFVDQGDTDYSLIPSQADNLTVVLNTIYSGRGAFDLKPDGSYSYKSEADKATDLFFGYDLRNAAAYVSNHARVVIHSSTWALDQARLQSIGLANANFETSFNRVFYPSNTPVDANNHPLLSWRVHFLPFLGHSALYNRFRLNEPWNSAHNLPLLDEMPELFRSAGDDANANKTRYQVVADGSYPSSTGLLLNNVNRLGNINTFEQVADGVSSTLFVVQSGASKAIEWTKPEDLTYDPANPLGSLGNVGPYFSGLFGDGQVRSLPTSIANAKFDAMVRINDGVPVDPATETRRAKLLPNYPGDPIADGSSFQNQSLRQIAIAMQNHASSESFPERFPGATENGFSWRVKILPYIEQGHLHALFNFAQPWNSPHNMAVAANMPDVFRSLGDAPDSTTTRMRVLGGANMAYAAASAQSSGVQTSAFSDGLSHSILVAEVGTDLGVFWTQPEVLSVPDGDMWTSLGTLPEGQMRVIMGDGAVRNIPTSVPSNVLRGLATIDRADAGLQELEQSLSDLRTMNYLQMRKNLQDIGIAMHNYENNYNRIPHNFLGNSSTLSSVGLSWRVAILPFIEEQVLYNKFRLNEPWDSPHNLSLLPLMPSVFKTNLDQPFGFVTRVQRFTSSSASPGPVDPNRSLNVGDVTDGWQNTFFAVLSSPDQAVPWTKPDDLQYSFGMGWSALGDPNQTMAVFMDGSVKQIRNLPERYSQENLDRWILMNDSGSQTTPVRRVIVREDGMVEGISILGNNALVLEDPTTATIAEHPAQNSHEQSLRRISIRANADRDGTRTTRLLVGNSEIIEILVVDSAANQPAANVVGSFVNHVGYTGGGSSIDTGKSLAKESATPTLLTFDNLINSTRGINGLVFELQDLPGTVTAADFVFQMSPTGAFDEAANPVDNWETAPAPTSVAVTPGSPSRVSITWPDNAIANRWLRVTLLANVNTGLAASEVFYVGHLQGETTGASNGRFKISREDLLEVRSALSQVSGAGSIEDLDKNGVVLVADILAARSRLNQELTQITIPASESMGVRQSAVNEAGLSASSDSSDILTTSMRSQSLQSAAYAVAVDSALEDWYGTTQRRRGRRL